MKLPEPPTLRALNRDDESERNLVLAGWMRTYARSIDARYGLETPVLFRMLKPVVHALVDRSTVTLACLADHPEAILGWVASEPGVLHFVCVKPRWSRLGVAAFLLAGFRDQAMRLSHMTADGRQLLEALAPASWKYEPMARFEEAA